MSAWTDETVAKLRLLWAGGETASQIAKALGNGLTRNAIISKAHRIGLADRKRPAARKAKVPKRAPFMERVARPRPAITLLPKEPPAPPSCDPVRLLDIRDGQCRWPIGDVRGPDTMMCGGSTERVHYCAYHVHLAGGHGTPSERSAVKDAKKIAA